MQRASSVPREKNVWRFRRLHSSASSSSTRTRTMKTSFSFFFFEREFIYYKDEWFRERAKTRSARGASCEWGNVRIVNCEGVEWVSEWWWKRREEKMKQFCYISNVTFVSQHGFLIKSILNYKKNNNVSIIKKAKGRC